MALGYFDTPGNVGVVDVSAALRFDREILPDLVHFDAARPIVLHYHRAAHVRRVNPTRTIALDGKRASHVSNVDVAGAIVHLHIATDVFDREVTRAVGNAHRSG